VRPLEDRLAPAVFTVTNTGDTGTGSGNSGDLRYCITQANATSGSNTIDATGVTGTILLTASLPNVGRAVTINGPGASLLTINGNGTGTGSVLNVSTVGAFVLNGVTLTGGAGGGLNATQPAGVTGFLTVTVSNSVISGNSGGGGIRDVSAASLTIVNSTIANNTSSSFGGGISMTQGGGPLTVSNSSIVNNVAPAAGGVYRQSAGVWTGSVVNCTITGNTATNGYGGGIVLPSGTTLSLDNSIVSGNSATSGGPDIYSSGAASAKYSALGTTTGYTLTDLGNNLTGAASGPLALQLGPLTNYPVPGASPPRTMPLIPLGGGSAAIGAGDPAQNGTADERGVARPQQTGANPQPDIGAFERVPGPDAWAPVAHLAASDVLAGGGSVYTFTVTYVAGDPVNLTTLGAGNVSVVTPAGVPPVAVTYVGADTSNPNGVVATYQFVPLGGNWAAAAGGTYSVMMNPYQVMNADGFVPDGLLGTFRVAIPQTFTVTNTNDDTNPGSLRYAITQANASAPSADTIQFDPALFAAGSATISLLSDLPTVTDSLTITGPGSGLLTVQRAPATYPSGNLRIFGSTSITVNLSGVTISGAQTFGVGVGVANVTLSDVAVRGNGGGIGVNAGGSLAVRNSTVSGNSGYGGISLAFGTSLLLTDSTVSANATGSVGGGISGGTNIIIRNSTIAGNSASGGGGGVALQSSGGTYLIQNSTITGNTAAATNTAYDGGGIRIQAGTLVLQSTIVAGNVRTPTSAGQDIAAYSPSTITADHCLIGAADGLILGTGSTNNQIGTSANPLDPHLGPLADNGGLTKTYPLMAGSPALNAGSNPANLVADQRGQPRVVGTAPDIGAYEYVPITFAGIQVNDGSAQRSEVRSLTVTFSGPVSFAGGNAAAAFQLQHVQTGDNVNLAAAVSTNGAGQTVVTLTFLPTNVNGVDDTDPVSGQNGGQLSLADGRYQLTVLGSAVTDASLGWAFDGDGDGVPGGSYVTPAETSASPTGLHLYRLFGDATGDGIVDLSDLTAFRGAYNAGTGNAAYLSYLDADNSGAIDLTDLTEFRSRYNHSVFV
jgi:parallel beta-helix repeat protein